MASSGAQAENLSARKGRGRPKGSKNKTSLILKHAILSALDAAGGEAYLQRIANDEPKAFCSLLGRVLPMTVSGDSDDGSIAIRVVERKIVKS